MENIYILNIETSTKNCSVSIFDKENLICTQSLLIDRSHSSKLLLIIDQLLHNSELTVNDFKAISVTVGPGSYTGLRVGAAVAKGLSYGLDLPLITINSLKSMTFQVLSMVHDIVYLCPMIDARRMEVYTCLYKTEKGKIYTIQDMRATILDKNYLSSYLKDNRVLFFGDGSDKFKVLISNENEREAKFAKPEEYINLDSSLLDKTLTNLNLQQAQNAVFVDEIYPDARYIGKYVYHKYVIEDFIDIKNFDLIYLKSPLNI